MIQQAASIRRSATPISTISSIEPQIGGALCADGQLPHKPKAIVIPITLIDPFPSHPFQVRDDGEMAKLVESVKEYGVLMPAVARIKDDGRYELVSGHRRKHACEIAGIETMPVIVRDMTREQAVVAMADSNSRHAT